MSGLDVAGLLNRLVDRQHDDFQQAVQREQSARAEARVKVSEREKRVEQREQRAYQREKEARAEAYQRQKEARDEAFLREQAVKAEAYQRQKEARAMAKAEALQREKQVRSEVEKEMEIDRLRRKLAKKEAKERQPEFSEPPGWSTYSFGVRPNRGSTGRCAQSRDGPASSGRLATCLGSQA